MHDLTSSSAQKLRQSIQSFAYAEPLGSPSRFAKPAPSGASSTTSPKRSASSAALEEGSRPKNKSQSSRGYAPPSTYANLSDLQDYLEDGLDIVICGINPGKTSAIKGHHFAHPSNRFWKSLHQSGLTARLLDPSEDSTLPSLYSIGMTNLVNRPSIEAAELSKEEMRISTSTLCRKMMRYKPRMLCIVGKVAWDAVRFAITHPSKYGLNTVPCKVLNTSPKALRSHYGLQEYRIMHSKCLEPMSATRAVPTEGLQDEGNGSTLIYVVPCSSGRVVQQQILLVPLFTELKQLLERVKLGQLERAEMTDIYVSESEATDRVTHS